MLPATILVAVLLAAPLLRPGPIPALVLLALLGFALAGADRPWRGAGRVVAIAGVAWLSAELSWLRPLRQALAVDPARPVRARFVPAAGWDPSLGGWSARGSLQSVQQGDVLERPGLEVMALVAGEKPPPPALAYRLRGYLHPPREFWNGTRRVVGGWQIRVSSRRFLEPVGRPRPSWIRPVRARLARGLGPSDSSARNLVAALLLGESRALSEDVRRGLRRCGLAHLFAISGLHVGMLAAVAYGLASSLPRAWRTPAALVAVTLYAALVGPRVSVLRSTLMLVAVLGARSFRRPPSSLNGLSLAVLALLVMAPGLAWELSFRLTAAATAGILVLGPRLRRAWGGGRGTAAVAACVGAQLATLPIVLPAFSVLPTGAVLLNLLAIPWTALCLAVCLLWALVCLASPCVAGGLLPALCLLATPYEWIALLPPHPVLSVPLVTGSLGGVAMAVGLQILLERPRIHLPVAFALICWCVSLPRGRELEVVALDVGQGDALLLRDGRAALLVDGGGWSGGDFGGRVLVPALARLRVRELDAIVLSHPDWDHCGGLADLLAYLPVGELWLAPGGSGTACGRRLLETSRVRPRLLWRGDRFAWKRWLFTVAHPPPGVGGAPNERSLVLRAEAGGHSLLLTGDIGAGSESEMIAAGVRLRSDVLKVAHHGSRSSTSTLLLSAVHARVAVVSAGRGNAYGHPSELVLERLAARGIRILRTDMHGWIRIRWRADGPLRISTALTPSLAPAPARRLIDPAVPIP